MTHFGILCPPGTGHLNTLTPLGQELQRRGHAVTLFGVPDTRSRARAAGFDYWPIGEAEFPLGSVAASLQRLGALEGLAALLYTNRLFVQGAAVVLRDAPPGIQQTGVEALLVDQTLFEGTTIAEFLHLPFITICSALLLNPEPNLPPIFTAWPYSPSRWARLRNRAAAAVIQLASRGLGYRSLIGRYRQQWGLPGDGESAYLPLAEISHQPAEFEFPRSSLPPNFHFTGPFATPASREPTPFPFERLTGQPLIYASLGTIQNRLLWAFEAMAQACADLDIQLVISLGGAAEPESLGSLPGQPLVVKYAPQLELLAQAALTITHAGLNTTLESLSYGVPMVAIPITNDQPGVAARIAWTGTGEVVPLKQLTPARLQAAITQVLRAESYRHNALRLQDAIQRAGGVRRAADIVEEAVTTGKPVFRGEGSIQLSP